MKTLFSATLVALLCMFGGKTTAQNCNTSNPVVSNVVRTPNGSGTCTLTFDLQFTIDANGGSKYIIIHLWPIGSYPTNIVYNNAPDASQLTAAYGTISIDNEIRAGHPAPTYFSAYPFDNPVTTIVPANNPVRTGTGPYNYIIQGVSIPGVSCSGSVAIKGDIWASNANSTGPNSPVGCVTQNLNLVAGDPTLSAPVKNCTNPRTVSFIIGTTSTTSIDVTYKIYKDDDVLVSGQPAFNPLSDADVTNPGSNTVTVSSSSSQGVTTGFAGNGTVGENSNYWVVATYTPPAGAGTPSSVARITGNACAAPLPVKLSGFSVSRSGSSVLLKWETATEENNAGFIIQRKDANLWLDVNFIASAAPNGSSSQKSNYQYIDKNTFGGVSQYRIVQKDIDGKLAFSEIRAVKGTGQNAAFTVYPNPAKGGNFSVVLDGDAAHTVYVMDASGRTVSQITDAKGLRSISGLKPGHYLVIAENTQTGARTTQKIIVQ